MTLERFNLIRSKKIGKSLHYFITDVSEDYDQFKVLFLNPLIPKILEEFFKDELIKVSTIGETLDMYSGIILYHIKKMKELDLLRSTKNQAGKTIIVINIELLKKYNDYFKEPNFSELLQGIE